MTGTPKKKSVNKKEVEIINHKKSEEYVFISDIKRNGKLYKMHSVCPDDKLDEMDKLGFIRLA